MKKYRYLFNALLVFIIGIIFAGCRQPTPPHPPSQEEHEKPIPPFTTHVYFENSYSMNGYLESADLKAAIYNLLVNMKGVSNKVKYGYINSIVIPSVHKSPQSYSNSLTNNVFNSLGGDRGSTDIADVLKNVLARTDKDNLSILISDFEVSPPGGKNQDEYLKLQQVGLKDAFLQLKRNQAEGVAVAVFKMQAEYNGIYYSATSGRIPLKNVKRPYYIWIIGSTGQIKKVMANGDIGDKNKGFQNAVIFASVSKPKQPPFKICRNHKLRGSFSIKSRSEIQDVKTKDKEFQFQVAVDFKHGIKPLSYFNDPKLYQVSNMDYTVSVEQLTEVQKSKMKLSTFTHLLTFSTNKLINEELEISVLDMMPEWIAESNSTNTDSIATSSVQQNQTFGIKSLLDGVNDAYTVNGQNQIINQFKIKISR